jgi:hypothetical protein
MATQLQVLVLQAEHVRQQIEAMRRAAREHGLTFDPAVRRFDDTEALCLAAEYLWGQVWAGFKAAADEAAQRGTKITDKDRQQAADAAGRA